jgi:hypothetical protein
MNTFAQGMGFCELQTKRGVMRRKESSREKMGCFGGRIPNRLRCNGAPVISNCSIMKTPGTMVTMAAMMIMLRAQGPWHHGLEGSSFPLLDQDFLGHPKGKQPKQAPADDGCVG